jgi:phosphatidylserine/phosphatidylglycerophosphate/cardiolipin synthase-like enzyme
VRTRADARPADEIAAIPTEPRRCRGGTPPCSSPAPCRALGSPFAIGPRHGIRELKAAHRSVIRSARRLLYIEAQFFRSKDAADWIEEALRRNPELEVIILIANAPEEIAFEGQTDNLAHRHGEHLQARALGRLLRRPGPQRVGLFTLAKQAPVAPSEEKFEETRGTAFGSGLIHIHSKLLIADDDVCLLSSANINGRSFEWDTELGFIWSEKGDAIAEFRRRLWWQLFGGSLPEQMNLEGWRDVARFNSGAEPESARASSCPISSAAPAASRGLIGSSPTISSELRHRAHMLVP